MDLLSTGILPQHYTASQHSRPRLYVREVSIFNGANTWQRDEAYDYLWKIMSRNGKMMCRMKCTNKFVK